MIWYLLKQFICSFSIYYIFSSYVELTKNIFTLYLICSILSHKSNFAKLKFSLWFFCAKMLPCRHIFFANYRYKSPALINTIFPLKSWWQNLKGKRKITQIFFFVFIPDCVCKNSGQSPGRKKVCLIARKKCKHVFSKLFFYGTYSPFHNTLPKSSLQMHCSSVRFYETGYTQILAHEILKNILIVRFVPFLP